MGHIAQECKQNDICYNCNLRDHYAKDCRRGHNLRKEPPKEIKTMTARDFEDKDLEKTVQINGAYVKAYIDTGSQVNVLWEEIANILGLEKKCKEVVLNGFAGGNITATEEVSFELMVDKVTTHTSAVLVPNALGSGRVALVIGQPTFKQNISLVVNRGVVTVTSDDDICNWLKRITLTDEKLIVEIRVKEKASVPVNQSTYVPVDLVECDSEQDVSFEPKTFMLGAIAYCIPGGVLKGRNAAIIVTNLGAKEIQWEKGELVTRGQICKEHR